MDWKRVSSTSEVQRLQSSVAVIADYSQHHSSRNVSWPQWAPSAVRHEAAVICQVERLLPRQRLANQTCHFELDSWHALGWVDNGVSLAPAWWDHDVACQWSVVQWRSAQTATCTVECLANRRAANYNSPTGKILTTQLRFLQLPPSLTGRVDVVARVGSTWPDRALRQ